MHAMLQWLVDVGYHVSPSKPPNLLLTLKDHSAAPAKVLGEAERKRLCDFQCKEKP